MPDALRREFADLLRDLRSYSIDEVVAFVRDRERLLELASGDQISPDMAWFDYPLDQEPRLDRLINILDIASLGPEQGLKALLSETSLLGLRRQLRREQQSKGGDTRGEQMTQIKEDHIKLVRETEASLWKKLDRRPLHRELWDECRKVEPTISRSTVILHRLGLPPT